MVATENQASSDRTRSVHRSIAERIVIEGSLVLESPGSFGNGDADAFTDISIMEDETDGSSLLTGTSIAGALRNYLRERELGYGKRLGDDREENSFHVALFGGVSGDEDGSQSPLIVHDALGRKSNIELRDGVKIDGQTRTAADEKKFDFELLAAGTTFDLRFELLISVAEPEPLINALVTALVGSERIITDPFSENSASIANSCRASGTRSVSVSSATAIDGAVLEKSRFGRRFSVRTGATLDKPCQQIVVI